ncbi:MAG: formylglycine-generating enzyme family protein [Sedimenticola sp.]
MKKTTLVTVSTLFTAILGSYNSAEGKGIFKIKSEPADALIHIDDKRKADMPTKKRQSKDHKKQVQADVTKEILRLLANMVTIPSGSFRMGSNNYDSQKPVHTVNISGFRMSKHEVTQALWMAVMGENPSHFSGMNNPVEQVSWDDVQAFLGKLNQQSGQIFRLPSEAEWEYAARAGTTTAFSTGECINTDQANYNGKGDYKKCGAKTGVYRKKTVPVGSFQPNKFGLHEMHGNVWEWVQDCWNDNYNGAPANGSAWLIGACKKRVLRGGSWRNGPAYMPSAYRYWFITDYRYFRYGFRLVQD